MGMGSGDADAMDDADATDDADARVQHEKLRAGVAGAVRAPLWVFKSARAEESH